MSVLDVIVDELKNLSESQDGNVKANSLLQLFALVANTEDQVPVRTAILHEIATRNGVKILSNEFKSLVVTSEKKSVETRLQFCLGLMGHLVREQEQCGAQFAEEAIVPALVEALQSFSGNEIIVIHALEILWTQTTALEEENMTLFKESDAVRHILNMMQLYEESADVILFGLGSLSQLSVHAMYEVEIGSTANGFKVILSALENFGEASVGILATGLSTLANTSNILQNQRDIAKLGGIDLIIALTQFCAYECPRVLDRALWVLRNLSRTEPYTEQIGSELSGLLVGVLPDFLATERFDEVLVIVSIIVNLVESDANKTTLKSLDAEKVLYEVMSNCQEYKVQKQVIKAITALR